MRHHGDPRYLRIALFFFALFLGVLAIFFSVNCAPSRMGKALNVGVGVSAAADLVTTRQAIESGRGREANPVMGQGALQQGLLKVAGASAVIGAAHLLEMKGRGEFAHVLRIVYIAFNVAIAAHNHQVGR